MNNLDKFTLAMQFIGLWEWGNRKDGYYTNDPTDPGGETKFGISKRAHPYVDIRNLTYEQAKEIYKEEYWDKVNADSLSFDWAMCLFDTAVNCGVSRSLLWQKRVNAVEGRSADVLEWRRAFYIGRVKKEPSQVKYLKGWFNRVNDLKKFIELNK